MTHTLWNKYNTQSVDSPCEIMFIDASNQICKGTVEKLPVKNIEVIAYRVLVPVTKPVKEVKKFVAYWNWKKGKFWPFSAKNPPNPKLPYYFRVEISYDNPNDIQYFMHSEVIV